MMLVAILAAVAPSAAKAQYFGRNKVQYQTFDFRVLSTQHYDLHYYPAESLATADAARMAERWYSRLSGIMRQQFNKKPLVFYADHPDFEQTNVIGGFIDQSTGGVTEAGRNRVVMPFTGIYQENDHVLGHEMVHAFQYNIAQSRRGGGQQGLNTMPLWVIEGMLASAPHPNASKVFLNWVLSREGQMAFQKITKENSLRVDIPKQGIVDPDLMLDPKGDYLFTGLEEHKKKINEFEPWLESLLPKK